MNSNRYDYTVEKLTTAISVFVLHPGDARARLNDAFLSFHTLQDKDFPPHLLKKWQWVMFEITKFGPLLNHKGDVWRGSVEHTMSRIHNKTASKIIKVIYELYWEVSENEQYL
jgi:hypothetical protein